MGWAALWQLISLQLELVSQNYKINYKLTFCSRFSLFDVCVAVLGVLGLLDYDAVEISNLHRQILHCEGRVGATKTHSAEKAIIRFTHQSRVNSLCAG